MSVVISSGHGLYVRGAKGVLDEVDEARKIVERVADLLRSAKVGVKTFHDNTSRSQNENLNTIVNYHNAQVRDRDVSVHLNAYQTTSSPMGTECLYVSQQALATTISAAMADAGKFKNRGAKKRTDLRFLNGTNKPAVLLEVCFVDSSADASLYRANFESLCRAIAESIGDVKLPAVPDEPQPPQPVEPPQPSEPPPVVTGDNVADVAITVKGEVQVFVNGECINEVTSGNQLALTLAHAGDVVVTLNGEFFQVAKPGGDLPACPGYPMTRWSGKVSWFGGPDDMGVTPSEGLAFIHNYDQKPDLFLDKQPAGTTGLARRLDPEEHYIALRWDYGVFPKEFLRGDVVAKVTAPKTGRTFFAAPADWGPHVDTKRVADISPGLMDKLGIKTDDVVEVEFPYENKGV